MAKNEFSFSKIQKIDNSKERLPKITFLFLIFLIIVFVWFFRGGSFRFYASLFFGLYFLTKSTWISIILVGVVQTLIFLPFRIINETLSPDLKEFEREIETTENEKQEILITRRIQSGSWSVVFHTLNFILLALAFFSVGRVFFMDFYHHPINASQFLYKFIPYPIYPLQGTIFRFPWIHVLKTTALNWSTIFTIWGIIFGFFILLRFIWSLLRHVLSESKVILSIRIKYNHLLIFFSSFIGTLFLVSLYFFRHLPTASEFIILSADLTKQNTGFNFITALTTAAATIVAGLKSNQEAINEARLNHIPLQAIINVSRQRIKICLRNAFLCSFFAFWVTRLMPCSHDLSVLSFEVIYLISPLTFDRFIKKVKPTSVETPIEIIS